MNVRAASVLVLALGLFPRPLGAQESYTPTKENLEARASFRDLRFGLFIHFGVYSVLGDGEWVMNQQKIKVSDYEKLPAFFNPTGFDPKEWVAAAKGAGMRYITITAKHHDGFAMFSSKATDWNIIERTPYKKDVLGMLAEECRKQGLKLFFYYSQLDWHHQDYFPRGETGHATGRPSRGEFDRYLDFMDAQLRELLTNYGPIGGIWFDGSWDKPGADWRLERTYRLIHDLQPAALIGSNHHKAPHPGEDFQMFEKDLPGGKTSGFNQDQEVSEELPKETCETINNSWGFNLKDRSYKSAKDLVQYLARAAGNDANFLLNVGPMPDGRIQGEFLERLKDVGAWTARYGESIYGTRGGPLPVRNWGATTQRGEKVYVHVLDWPDASLALPKLKRRVKAAAYLKDMSKASFRELDDSLVLTLADAARDPYDTVVVLDLGSQ